jgi:ribosomal protein L7/L12
VDDAMLARRFGLIDQRLRALYEHLGIPWAASDGELPNPEEERAVSTAPVLPAEVVELARAGHANDAVSRLRQLTGMSLLEAKRAVDTIAGA